MIHSYQHRLSPIGSPGECHQRRPFAQPGSGAMTLAADPIPTEPRPLSEPSPDAEIDGAIVVVPV
jgi:hypothetical protein